MTKVVRNELIPCATVEVIPTGAIFSWGSQLTWFVKTKKGARVIGADAPINYKLSEDRCQELSKNPTFCIAGKVYIERL